MRRWGRSVADHNPSAGVSLAKGPIDAALHGIADAPWPLRPATIFCRPHAGAFQTSAGPAVPSCGWLGTLIRMQLRIARLCLDCEEVHDAQQCPVCASEMFAPISRWVPVPERRGRPRPPVSNPRADVYRALTDTTEARPSTAARLFKSGVLGLTAVGLIGWFMRTPRGREPKT